MQVKDYDLNITPQDSKGRLTARELEIFTLGGQGFNCEQIGQQLSISRRTVESHRDHIKGKLGITSIIHYYQLAYRFVSEL